MSTDFFRDCAERLADLLEVAEPASDAERAVMARRLGRIPRELDELLSVTSGLWGRGLDLVLDPDRGGMVDAGHLGLGALVRVRDHGNGDGLYMEPHGDTCRLFWVGHDPWDVVLVARSLRSYLARLTLVAERMERAEEGGRAAPSAPYAPLRRVEPEARDDVLARLPQGAERAWLAGLSPGTWTWDFTRVPERAEAVVRRSSGAPAGRLVRSGELLALVPSSSGTSPVPPAPAAGPFTWERARDVALGRPGLRNVVELDDVVDWVEPLEEGRSQRVALHTYQALGEPWMEARTTVCELDDWDAERALEAAASEAVGFFALENDRVRYGVRLPVRGTTPERLESVLARVAEDGDAWEEELTDGDDDF